MSSPVSAEIPGTGHGRAPRARWEAVVDEQRPLLRPAPRGAMFFPLVVLAAVLPGLYALNRWDLTPPGPWWGLRGLAVSEGMLLDQIPLARSWPASERNGYRALALQPPLYAWLEGLGLRLSPSRHPLATVLPSYAAGVLLVVLVFAHGRLWFGPGVGVVAAMLTAFNRQFLLQMQQATPSTLGVAGLLLFLLAYARQVHSAERIGWPGIVMGGLGLGISLMALGLFGLLGVPVVLLHQALLSAEAPAAGRRGRGLWRRVSTSPTFWSSLAMLALGLALAAPWFVSMYGRYGEEFAQAVRFLPRAFWDTLPPGLLPLVLTLSPATLALSLLGLARLSVRTIVADASEPDAAGGSFWIAWLATAALCRPFWPGGVPAAFGLALLAPLNLLAAWGIVGLASRRIPARNLIWLAPLTALTVAWWLSSSLREALTRVTAGSRPDAATLLGLHLGLDLILVLALVTRVLDRWAQGRDPRRRLVLGVFLLAVLGVHAAAGLREVGFRHIETHDLLDLRTQIVRRNRLKPIEVLAVVGSDGAMRRGGTTGSPGGRLRFILRSALPHLAQVDLNTTEDLLALPDRQRVVVLVGADQQLAYATQSQLKLEMIHPGQSGGLSAFATTYVPPRRPGR